MKPTINKILPLGIENIIERITDAFVALDNKWCYTYMNKKAGEIFNRNPNEMIGKHIWTEFPEGIDQPFYKAYHQAMEQQQYIYLEDYYPPYEKWFENSIYPSSGGLTVFFRDITYRKRAEEEISNNNEQLKLLTAHLQNVREDERKRIGREIHDELGQQLTAVKMDVAWINKQVTDYSSPIKSKLKNIINLLNGSNKAVRKILNELRVDILDDFGLVEAMVWQGQQFTSNTGIPVLFSSDKIIIKPEEIMATCIYRAYQEALTNIIKHAEAKKVVSSLKYVDNKLILEIKDDGFGFNKDEQKTMQSFGLLGMKERVASLNGTFELNSSPETGTKITISLPFKT